MKKLIKTAKAALLAVKLPEGAKNIKVTCDEIYYHSKLKACENVRQFLSINYKGNWQPIGFLKDITEDQAKEIVDLEYVCYYGYAALELFNMLMEKHEIYLENPYKYAWEELCIWGHGGFAKDGKTEFELFTQAEENTGNWYILKNKN